MRVRRRVVETDMDKKILTGLIVSDSFCSEIIPKIKLGFFKTDYVRKLASWIIKYHGKYRKAPRKVIKDIFESESPNLKEEDSDLIKYFLRELSDKFEEKNFNAAFLADKTVEYFKERALILLYEGIQSLVELGKIKEAEEFARSYREVVKTITVWFNPFDPLVVDSVYEKKDENNLFAMPGALSRFFGTLKRTWLVGIMGPMKRGKSWWLQEFAIQSIFNNLRTVFISLEMSKEEVSERLYKRITALSDEEGKLLYPCFDCVLNQNNTCVRKERENKFKLLKDDGSLPEYSSKIPYKPCTYCRDNLLKDYQVATWFIQRKVKELTKKQAKKYSQGLLDMYGDNFRVIAYPANTANCLDIKRDIEELEYTEGFIPDVVIVDYSDILKPEHPTLTGRERVNETWLMLKNISQTKHCLVVTGTQSSRKSIYKFQVTQDDTSEDIRKLAHTDVMVTLNQTPEEEEMGIMRLGTAVHRHKKNKERLNVIVIYSTEVGQPLLDSEIYSNISQL